MWARNYPINIITTAESWYEEHARILQKQLIEIGFLCNVLFSHEMVEENSISFYLSYQKIVPKETIEKAWQSLVIHASDLPEGKGFSPWVWQILEGKDLIPLCLFEIDEYLDNGPIFQREVLSLKGTELLEEIRFLLAKTIGTMVIEYLMSDKQPQSFPQVGNSTFYRKRTVLDSELDVHKTIAEQFNLLRVVDNSCYPAFFVHKGRKYILKIEVRDE